MKYFHHSTKNELRVNQGIVCGCFCISCFRLSFRSRWNAVSSDYLFWILDEKNCLSYFRDMSAQVADRTFSCLNTGMRQVSTHLMQLKLELPVTVLRLPKSLKLYLFVQLVLVKQQPFKACYFMGNNSSIFIL